MVQLLHTVVAETHHTHAPKGVLFQHWRFPRVEKGVSQGQVRASLKQVRGFFHSGRDKKSQFCTMRFCHYGNVRHVVSPGSTRVKLGSNRRNLGSCQRSGPYHFTVQAIAFGDNSLYVTKSVILQ